MIAGASLPGGAARGGQRTLKRVHRAAYVDLIFEHAPKEGYVQLDPDTAMNPYSLAAARRAAGAGVLAVDEVISGRVAKRVLRGAALRAPRDAGALRWAFASSTTSRWRPPTRSRSKGSNGWPSSTSTCITATAPRTCSARPSGAKRVLMASFFQHPFYPDSGTVNPAPNMFNVPLAAGSDGAAAKRALEEHWAAGARGLQAANDPDLRGLRRAPRGPAGRHGARGGGLRVDDPRADVAGRAPREKRIVSMLEGGYNLSALGRSAAAHVRTLAGR